MYMNVFIMRKTFSTKESLIKQESICTRKESIIRRTCNIFCSTNKDLASVYKPSVIRW